MSQLSKKTYLFPLVALLITVVCLVVAFVLTRHPQTDNARVATDSQPKTVTADSQSTQPTIQTKPGDSVLPSSMRSKPQAGADTAVAASLPVQIQKVQSSVSSSIPLTGIVEAKSQVKVFPAINGQVVTMKVKEGDVVKEEDVLFILGGVNDQDHSILKQYELAVTNYQAAQDALNNTDASTQAALNTAALQLESAQHLAEGQGIDLYQFSQSRDGIRSLLGIARESLSETQTKNEHDLANIKDSIEKLNDDLDTFYNDRDDAIRELENQIDDAPDDTTYEALKKQLKTLKKDLQKQEDALIDQQTKLEQQYEALQSGTVLTENQVSSQIQQLKNQYDSTTLTQDSTGVKIGYENGETDALHLAMQGLENTKLQRQTALTQATAQRDLARINLSIAANAKNQLLVRAPMDGMIASVPVHVGDTVAPQAPMAEMLTQDHFVAKIYVDSRTASHLQPSQAAEVMIGGKPVRLPIEQVGFIANATSHLIPVTITMPNMLFYPNQVVKVNLPLDYETSNNGNAFFVPLDAVTIATEEQFVYVLSDGKAQKTLVKLGQVRQDMVEVVDGLHQGDVVITTGAKDLTDGQEVMVDSQK